MSFEGNDPRMTASEPRSPSLGFLDQNTSRLVHEFRELAHDHLELATLEARFSVNTLLRMAIIAIVTALVLASAWLALVASAALALISLGVAPVLAMLLLAAANLLLGFAGWQRIRQMSHWLGWPATQRAIKPSPASQDQRGAA